MERNSRTDITQCEECKEKGKDGVFLVLGFFNGFICTACGIELERLLVQTLQSTLIPLPSIPDGPAIATGVAESSMRPEFKYYEEGGLKIPYTPGLGLEAAPYPAGIDTPAAFGDTPTCAQNAPRTILGEKVTQDHWDALENHCTALGNQIAELLNWKMDLGVNWARLKNNLNDAQIYAGEVEDAVK